MLRETPQAWATCEIVNNELVSGMTKSSFFHKAIDSFRGEHVIIIKIKSASVKCNRPAGCIIIFCGKELDK